jgi:uncharacterized protein
LLEAVEGVVRMMVLPIGIAQGAEIVETKKVSFDSPIVVVGFPGPGLIGTIVTHHLIGMLNMDLIGTIRSPFTPSISPFYGGMLRAPIRIYATKDGKLVSIISEVPLPTISLPYFAYAVSEWALKNGASELICVEGLGKKEEGKKCVVYGVAEPEVLGELEEHDIPRLPAGFVGGLPGAIMNECLMRGLKGLCLLVEATQDVPDPASAAEVVKVLSRVRGLNTDVKALVAEAKNIKKQMRELAAHTEKGKLQEMKNSPVPIYT